jgi:hypothetical protein
MSISRTPTLGIDALSPELLIGVFKLVRGDQYADMLLPTMLVSRRWKVSPPETYARFTILILVSNVLKALVEPLLWQQLRFSQPRSLAGAAHALTVAFGLASTLGSHIRSLVITPNPLVGCKTNINLLGSALDVLSHASNLVRLELKAAVQHCMILAVIHTSTAQTLTELHFGPIDDALDVIIYIDAFKNLNKLDIAFNDVMFVRQTHYKPWYLPCLKTLICFTWGDEDDPCSDFLAECSLPVLQSLERRVLLDESSAADSFLRLYQSKRNTLQEFYVHMTDDFYNTIIPHLTDIDCLIVRGPMRHIVALLPPRVSKLRLRCESADDLEDLFDTLDGLSRSSSHSVKIIRIELIDSKFLWVLAEDDESIVDKSIYHTEFIGRLLRYTSQGLIIEDEDDKSILDYIPWRR